MTDVTDQAPQGFNPTAPDQTVPALLQSFDGFTNAAHGRLILEYDEDGQHHHNVEHGWGLVTPNGWLLWKSAADPDAPWQSWPPQHVICVEWTKRPEELF